MANTNFIPRPLVRTNQVVIVLSVVLTWLTGAYWLLLLPFIAGLGGLIFHYNPIMKLARLFLKKPLASYIKEDVKAQQFNQLLATTMLGIAFAGFLLNVDLVGYIFSAFVFAAAFVAILGFCVGCFIRYRFLLWQSKRKAS